MVYFALQKVPPYCTVNSPEPQSTQAPLKTAAKPTPSGLVHYLTSLPFTTEHTHTHTHTHTLTLTLTQANVYTHERTHTNMGVHTHTHTHTHMHRNTHTCTSKFQSCRPRDEIKMAALLGHQKHVRHMCLATFLPFVSHDRWGEGVCVSLFSSLLLHVDSCCVTQH